MCKYKCLNIFPICFALVLTLAQCTQNNDVGEPVKDIQSSILNLAHLDHLGEVVNGNKSDIRIVHIYSEHPEYGWVADEDEGTACVDDISRAAVLYLRHYELHKDPESAEKAKQLLRFILYMQTDEGLFHNFVYTNQLDKNITHQNSVADRLNWWAARAIWSLGTAARVFANEEPELANIYLEAIDRAFPHLNVLLENYPRTIRKNGFVMPTWLINGQASDASSELLLGLTAAYQVSKSEQYSEAIQKISEGISMMQYGKLGVPPYGAHISWEGGWHGWGNSQSMALAEAGFPESAVFEAENFYPWLLVNGWIHSFNINNPDELRQFEQIAYAVRPVAVGLIRLFEQTGNENYAIMAGLAASWFTGNNIARTKMYNKTNGYGHDGINGVNDININAGAESTIEANMTILEVENHPVSRGWMHAKAIETVEGIYDGHKYNIRLFETNELGKKRQIAIALNISLGEYSILSKNEYNQLISL